VLVTHSALFAGPYQEEKKEAEWSVGRAASVLAGATAAIAWISEIMVGAIEPTAHEFGLSNVFVGVFVVAILGNAAEHATAIGAAMKDRMDLALSIAIGSSVQVALFVAPVLVFASRFLGPASGGPPLRCAVTIRCLRCECAFIFRTMAPTVGAVAH